MNICTKYGFDILIISGSYGGHRRHTTYDGRRTTPRVWHKLPSGELKKYINLGKIISCRNIISTLIKKCQLISYQFVGSSLISFVTFSGKPPRIFLFYKIL